MKPSTDMDARIRARRARVRADAAKRRQRRTLSLFVLLVLVGGVAVALRSSLFEVSAIRVIGATGTRATEVRRAAAIRPGQHLLTVPLVLAQRSVERLPWVKEAHIGRSPPSTVSIEVMSRIPLLTVQTDDASWRVDADAVLVGGGKVPKAPVVAVSDTELPALGRPITDATVRDAVAVHTNLPSWLRNRVVAYRVAGPADLWLKLKVPPDDPAEGRATPVRVRFGTAKDVALKAEVIRVLLPQAAEQGHALDVRAPANPVVVPP